MRGTPSRGNALALVAAACIAALGAAPALAARRHASLALGSDHPQPGSRLLVVGRHFPARARVRLYLGRTRLKTLHANRRGRFRMRITVPSLWGRVYRITARARGVVTKVRFTTAGPPTPPIPPIPPTKPSPDIHPATLVAAGDIACKLGDPVTATTCRQKATSDLVLSLKPDAVATLGDAQYQKGELANYQSVFDPTWGRFKTLIRPAPGNHEYLEQPDHRTAVGHFTYFGDAAGDPAKGYYDYTIGTWHAFVLNTGDLDFNDANDCFPVSCAAGSAQEQWLRTELAKLPADSCVVAYWHHPRYTSYTPVEHAEVSALYDALYDYGAELILNGHAHNYERFNARDANDRSDPAYGVRELVVGTGGHSHHPITGARAGSVYRDSTNFGALELKLWPDQFWFRFVTEAGAVLDSGALPCHGPHP